MALRSPIRARSNDATAAPELSRGLLPGWAASIWFHVLLLLAASVGLRSCTAAGQRGEADADWKAVGLVTRLDESQSTASSEVNPEQPADDTQRATLDTSDLPTAELAASDSPPVALPQLPGEDLPPVIGPGAGVPRFSSSPLSGENGMPSSRATAAPTAPSGSARGDGFFGIRDEGSTFVYVIDSSGSMSDPDGLPMAAAKAELMASLASLDAEQQFQIIFYSERPQVMRLPGRPPEKLYWSSDINRTLARQFIAVIRPDAGTDHMKALRAAIEIHPDVIFFLTDAEDPALSAKDIDEVRRLNSGGTRIHAVEFGKGSRLADSTALERLAQQNGGAYQYRDVMRFRR